MTAVPVPGRAFTALINPVAGGGHAARRWEEVAALLRAAGADVRAESTRSREHTGQLAEAVAGEGRVVVAVGGDGMVRDVAGGVVRGGGTMAIVAAGRGNDLARRLGLPTDDVGTARILLAGAVRTLDVIEVNGSGGRPAVIVPGNVYAGVDAVANAMINNSRLLPPLLAYRLAPVRAVATWRAPTYALTVDGRTRAVTAHTVVVANSGAYGHGLDIVPQAEPDDGVLHVMAVGAGPRRAIVAFLREAKHGTHVERPEIDVVPGRQITIAADRDVPVYGDGDELGTLPVSMRIRPAALPVIVGAAPTAR